jgi:hypothetical protein
MLVGLHIVGAVGHEPTLLNLKGPFKDGGQTVLCREVYDALPVADEKTVCADEEGGSVVVVVSRFYDGQLQAERRRCLPNLFYLLLQADGRILGEEQSDLRGSRYCFLDELQLLGRKGAIRRDQDPGNVTAGSRKARDEAGRHRIDVAEQDNRNGGRCLLGRLDRRRADGQDDVHSELDQLARKPWEPVESTPGEFPFDTEVLAFDVALFAQ